MIVKVLKILTRHNSRCNSRVEVVVVLLLLVVVVVAAVAVVVVV